MISKLVVFNWKSNPQTLAESLKLAKLADCKNVIICPPFIYLSELKNKLLNASLGAQNVFWVASGGPYTGEISPLMLKNADVKYVIVGHSERRRLGETDEMINKKVKAVIGLGLKAILCVGEHSRKGDRKMKKVKEFIESQILKSLCNISLSLLKKRGLIIAYEPVWAISANEKVQPDNPEDSAQIISFIKEKINSIFGFRPKVLYGGSVTSQNIKSFLKHKIIDGVLVGSASLKVNEIKKIIKITKNEY